MLVSILLFTTHCTDDLPPSSPVVPPETQLESDTIKVTDFNISNVGAYTGNNQNFSFGAYSDAALGDLDVTGMWIPRLATVATVDTLTATDQLKMSFSITSQYGDTSSSATYEIYEIDQFWRASSWRPDSTLQLGNSPIMTFTVTNEDSIVVPLPDVWADQYKDLFQLRFDTTMNSQVDSIFARSFNGLAIRAASGTNRIMSSEALNTRLIIEKADTSHTITTYKSAYKYDRTNAPDYSGQGIVPIFSNFEQLIGFDFTVNSDDALVINGQTIRSKAISRAELLIYRDTETLEQTLPDGHTRPLPNRLNVYRSDPQSLFFDIAGNPVYRTSFNEETSTHRINLTNLLNSIILGAQQNEGRYYAVPGGGKGLMQPDIILGGSSSVKEPEIVITYSVSNEE